MFHHACWPVKKIFITRRPVTLFMSCWTGAVFKTVDSGAIISSN